MAKASCKAKTRTGARCPNNAGKSGYCFTHDPNRAQERRRARALGGYHRAAPRVSGDVPIVIATVADVLALVNATIADTWVLENSPARSRALLSCAEAALRALEIGELEERVKALEEKQNDIENSPRQT